MLRCSLGSLDGCFAGSGISSIFPFPFESVLLLLLPFPSDLPFAAAAATTASASRKRSASARYSFLFFFLFLLEGITGDGLSLFGGRQGEGVHGPGSAVFRGGFGSGSGEGPGVWGHGHLIMRAPHVAQVAQESMIGCGRLHEDVPRHFLKVAMELIIHALTRQ